MKFLMKSFFYFDNSSNFFWFYFKIYRVIGLSIWECNERLYKFFKFISIICLIGFWFFVATNFYNQLVLWNLDVFIETFSQHMIQVMGLYKFISMVNIENVIKSCFTFAFNFYSLKIGKYTTTS